MTQRLEIYSCEICGNIVEVLQNGNGTLVCCGKSMVLLKENTVDASKEKHVPSIEKIDGGVKVKIGKVAHPMDEKHYITLIEIIANEKVYRQYLNPGDVPEATFNIETNEVFARAYCNLHGLWKA